MRQLLRNHGMKKILACCVMLLLGAAFLSLSPISSACAQVVSAEPPNTCTDGPQFQTDIPDGHMGIVSRIAEDITSIMQMLSEFLFINIVEDEDFQLALGAAVTLYISIYGLLFTFGMVRSSLYDFIMRLAKIAILYILTQPYAWDYFNYFVVGFFNQLLDESILQITNIAVGGVAIGGWAPLSAIDNAIAKVISAKMAVHILALIFTSPYGFLYALILGIAIWSFIGLLLTGVWVYLTSLLIRGLLFGVAPIFLACILFDRTRHLFQGWLNQIINAILQPLLLFSFLAMFILLLYNAANNVLSIPVCWTEADETVHGTPFSIPFWRYTIPSSSTETGWEPYGGFWNTPPVSLMSLLVFLLLAELGKRFNHVVLMVARDISASSTDLSLVGSAFNDLLPTGRMSGTAPAGSPRGAAGGVPATGPAGAGSAGNEQHYRNLVDKVRDQGIVETVRGQFSDMVGGRK